MSEGEIFLTTPVNRKNFRCGVIVPPIGLLAIGSALTYNNYKVKIIDCQLQNIDKEKLKKIVKESNSKFFGITCHVDNRFEAFLTARIIKEINPRAIIILGGPLITVSYEEIIKNIKEVDYAVLGDGEEAILEIIRKGHTWRGEDVTGICYRRGKNIYINRNRRFIKDLNKLPFPDFELIKWEKYQNYFNLLKHIPYIKNKIDLNIPTAHLIFSRGCPYRCIFCTSRELGHGAYRIITPLRAVSQIEWFYKRGVNSFVFWDDFLCLDKRWFREFCGLIKDKKMRLIFKMSSRVDALLDEDIVKEASSIGCVFVTLGLENGSDRVLKLMNKNITTSKIRRVLNLLKKYNIYSKGGMLLNTPAETPEDIEESILFFDSLRRDTLHNVTVPSPIQVHPGTELERIAIEQRKKPFSWATPYSEKRNYFLNASETTPLYENIKTEQMLKLLCKIYTKNNLWYLLGAIIKNNFLHWNKYPLNLKDKIRMRVLIVEGIFEGIILKFAIYLKNIFLNFKLSILKLLSTKIGSQ